MVRWMCGVKLQASKGLKERLGLDDIILVLQQKKVAMVWVCVVKRTQ